MSNINIRRVKDAVTKEEFYPQTCIEAVVDENGDALGIDASPTDDSDKLVRSGGVKAAIDNEATARANGDSALGTRIDGANIGIQAAMAAVSAEQQRAMQAENAKYVKPAGGIPKADLASDVQASLDLAQDVVYDISAHNNNTAYASLAAALGTGGANIPQSLRKGGMSVRFVLSSDNKYVQYRLMSGTFSTTESDWQGVDDKPIAGSRNLVESGGVADKINTLLDKNVQLNTFGHLDTSTNRSGKIACNLSLKEGQIVRITATASNNLPHSCYISIKQSDGTLINRTILIGSNASSGTMTPYLCNQSYEAAYVEIETNNPNNDIVISVHISVDKYLEHKVDENVSAINALTISMNNVQENINTLNECAKYESISLEENFTNPGAIYYYDGSILDYSSYKYTNAILLKEGDIIFTDITESNTNVGVICETDSDGTWVRTVIKGSDTVIKYTAPCDMYVRLSAKNSNISHFNLVKNDITSSVIEQEHAKRYFGLGTKTVTYSDMVFNKRRLADTGEPVSLSGYAYTLPIQVRKGDVIFRNSIGVGVTTAFITKVDFQGNAITVVEIGNGTDVVSDYYYKVDFDGYVSISSLIDYCFGTLVISSDCLHNLINDTNNEFQAIKNSIRYEFNSINDDILHTGAIYYYDGQVLDYNSYRYTSPILLKAGDTVYTDIAVTTTDAIGVLCACTENGTWLHTIIRGSSDANIKYTALDDMYIIISHKEEYISHFKIIRCETTEALIGLSNVSCFLGIDVKTILYDDITKGGRRISTDGSIYNQSGYSYTTPIQVHKGDVVLRKNANIGTNTAFITKVDSEGNSLGVVLAGTGSTTDYYHIIDFDGYISISALTSICLETLVISSVLTHYLLHLLSNQVILDSNDRLISVQLNPLSPILRDCGYGCLIKEWGFIGDSYCSGETPAYKNGVIEYLDFYKWSWGQQYMKIIGSEGYNYSNGGQTAKGWLRSQGVVHDDSYIGGVGGGDWRLAQTTPKQGYIMSLGGNDNKYFGTDDPSSIYYGYSLGNISTDINVSDYTQNNENTFVGCYAGIIQRILSIQPRAKIFCVTRFQDDIPDVTNAVRSIVNLFGGNVFLIDLNAYAIDISQMQYYMKNGHPSPYGYAYMAYLMNTYIDYIIRNNKDKFLDVTLIGTDYTLDV